MKTIFKPHLLIDLIKSTALTVAGVSKIDLTPEQLQFDQNQFFIDVWLNQNILNIHSVLVELQKKIHYNISQQLDNQQLKINLILHLK